MKPSQVAASLRQIADKIERSTKPGRALVSADIRAVLAAMGGDTRVTIPVTEGSALSTDTDGELGIALTNALEALPNVESVEWIRHNLTVITKPMLSGDGGDPAEETYTYPLSEVLNFLQEAWDGKNGPEIQQAVQSLDTANGKYYLNGKEYPFDIDGLAPDDDNYF